MADRLILGLALGYGDQLVDLVEYLTAERGFLVRLHLLLHVGAALRLVEQVLTLGGDHAEALARIFVQSRPCKIQRVILGSFVW